MVGIRTRRAFSLIELVIVIVILGIIGAIAIPRMSRGSAGAADASLAADLAVLRNAIELYRAEHNGTYPAVATFSAQLTQWSDEAGATNAAPDSTHFLGPYLQAIPPIKVGANKGLNVVAATAADGVAWVYSETTGIIAPNAAGNDSRGVAYSSY